MRSQSLMTPAMFIVRGACFPNQQEHCLQNEEGGFSHGAARHGGCSDMQGHGVQVGCEVLLGGMASESTPG